MVAKPRTNKGDTTAQKAAARERAKSQESRTGIKPTASGSSGLAKFMANVVKREFTEIQGSAERVTGFPFIIADQRMTMAGNVILSVQVPGAYVHEVVDFMNATRLGFCWAEAYLVPRPELMEDDTPDEGSTK